MKTLEHKRVLITGASEGLGRQLALDFVKQGVSHLALVARRGELLKGIKAEVQRLAPKVNVTLIEADLADLPEIERVVATTLAVFEGRLDTLINNASTLGESPMPMLVDYPLATFEQVLKTNLLAPFVLIQKALPALIRSGGSIINVTSATGITGYAGWGAYGISKFALEGLSQTWAAELEESGVRVNWIDPGNMNTTMHRLAEPEEDPTTWADPADVTAMFVLLAADSSIHGKRFLAQEPDEVALAS